MDSFRPGTGSTAVEANCGRFRSLPPWIASYEQNGPPPPEPQQTVPSRPPQTVKADHNNAPAPPQRRVSRDGFVAWDDSEPAMPLKKKHLAIKKRRQTQRGKKWDHLRNAEPVIIPNHMMRYADSTSPWTGFVQASRYGRIPGERSQHVEQEKLDELMPGFNDDHVPRLPNTLEQRIRRSRRQALHEQVWRLLLNNPLVPALLRLFVLVTSAISLAFSGNLWLLYSDRAGGPGATLRSQWIVAIVVDCIVMPYVCYMTWDEYRGLQLGLRSPMQKVSLTLMDLFFIIFKSASTTLAFDSLNEDFLNINNSPRDQNVKMKALASFLLLGLFGWILNFTVNVFRLVRRLGGDEDKRPVS